MEILIGVKNVMMQILTQNQAVFQRVAFVIVSFGLLFLTLNQKAKMTQQGIQKAKPVRVLPDLIKAVSSAAEDGNDSAVGSSASLEIKTQNLFSQEYINKYHKSWNSHRPGVYFGLTSPREWSGDTFEYIDSYSKVLRHDYYSNMKTEEGDAEGNAFKKLINKKVKEIQAKSQISHPEIAKHTTMKSPVIFGIGWSGFLKGKKVFRHFCENDPEIEFKWLEHDGGNYGKQQIKDNVLGVEFIVKFRSSGSAKGAFTYDISGKTNNGKLKKLDVYLYFGNTDQNSGYAYTQDVNNEATTTESSSNDSGAAVAVSKKHRKMFSVTGKKMQNSSGEKMPKKIDFWTAVESETAETEVSSCGLAFKPDSWDLQKQIGLRECKSNTKDSDSKKSKKKKNSETATTALSNFWDSTSVEYFVYQTKFLLSGAEEKVGDTFEFKLSGGLMNQENMNDAGGSGVEVFDSFEKVDQQLIGDEKRYKKDEDTFVKKFEEIFPILEKGGILNHDGNKSKLNEAKLKEVAKVALSSLLGGIGFFSGKLQYKLTREKDGSIVLIYFVEIWLC